jgi:hypothetical protein
MPRAGFEPRVQAGEDSSCLTPRGHRDGPKKATAYKKIKHIALISATFINKGLIANRRDKAECRVWLGKPEVKRPLRRCRSRWKDNIKVHLREIEWDGME